MKYVSFILTLLIACLLAYYYSLVSFLLLAIIGLSLVFLLIIGISKIFKKDLQRRWLTVPSAIIVICIMGSIVGWARPLDPPVIQADDVSKVLAHAYRTDQADRKHLSFYVNLLMNNRSLRDSLRLAQVKRLYNEGLVRQPRDMFHAAFVFHHSRDSEWYKVAYQLAHKAASVDSLKHIYEVQWLAKAAYDRWLVSQGKPQKYGTQGKVGISFK